MTGYLIKEAGLSTLTRQARPPHVWSRDTRHIEIQAYYKYCNQNGLLTTTGEQSLKALTRKTFNHLLTASYTSAEDATRAWLQDQTGSMLTHLYDLWLTYFNLHRTMPDDEGVTYANLSVEAGYRRWLYDFLHLSTHYYDTCSLTEELSKKIVKTFNDSVSLSEQLETLINSASTYSDSINGTETVVLRLTKRFLDSVSLSEQTKLTVKKGFLDQIFTTDLTEILDGTIESFADSLAVSDRLNYKNLSKVFTGDAITFMELLSNKAKPVILDTLSLSEGIDIFLGAIQTQIDDVVLEEQLLLLQIKKFSDTLSLTEATSSGFAFCGGGHCGEYICGY